MKIYFNQVPDSDVQFFGDSGLFGPNDSDNFFYNYVEYGSNPGGLEEVMIADGCDREIPVNMEAIPDLIRALEKAYEMWTHIKTRDSFAKIAQNSEVELYVEDSRIAVNSESVQNAINDAE
jgi:hypothetical protein